MTHERIVRSTPLMIRAPREAVWAILTDLPRYHLWNTLSDRVESSLRLGEPVRLWVSDAGITGRTDMFEHRLVAIRPPEHIAWAFEQGQVRTRRDQFLEAVPGGCVYRTSDSFYGPLADQMVDRMGEAICRSFDELARSLRDFAEASARD